MKDPAEEIYESLNEELLLRWLSESKTETLHLEFKTAKCDGSFSKDDRKNLAKGISALANSEGGVLLWGAQDKKNSDGEKMLAGFIGFDDVTRALRRIEELTGEASSPPAPGVIHKCVEVEGKSLIATLVPASDAGPHMAKLGEDRYFQRSGGSSRRMEHFQVADMFGRRPHPKLRLNWCIRGPTEHRITVPYSGEVLVGIENTGRSIAHFPCLWLWLEESDFYQYSGTGLSKRGNEGLPLQHWQGKHEHWLRFEGTADHVIFPDTTRWVYQVRFEPVILFTGRDSCRTPLNLKYRIFADGIQPIEDTLQLSRDNLRSAIKKFLASSQCVEE